MQALEAVRGAQSGPVGLGERVELGGGREAPLKHVDCLGELLVPARRDLGQALLRLSEPGGPEDGGNLARHTLAQAMRDLGQHVALQVDSTALAAHLGQEAAHRGCQARVLIRDHELDAAETMLQELLEELRPAVLRFLRAQRDAQEPAVAVRAHGVGHERAHVLDLSGPAGIEERRVQVQVGVGPLDGCTPQRLHALVEPLRDPAHRRASHALTHECLGHVAHLALRHAAHVGLHHHRIDFFTPALVATHHVGGRAAFPAARDRHVDLTQARKQAPQIRPVPVALPAADPLESSRSDHRLQLLLQHHLER